MEHYILLNRNGGYEICIEGNDTLETCIRKEEVERIKDIDVPRMRQRNILDRDPFRQESPR